MSSRASRLSLLDTFVITGVLTIAGVRGYLALTGFPQVGGGQFHIAHSIWGGLALAVALMIALLGSTERHMIAAVLGGVGFGLFMDEIGKFVTKSNDYFFRPSAALMYGAFLVIWTLTRFIVTRRERRPFLSPAEWPKPDWLRWCILAWFILQLAGTLTISWLYFAHGGADAFRQGDMSTTFGVLVSLPYAVLLAYAIVRFFIAGHRLPVANSMRAISYIGLVIVYPFFSVNSPVQVGIVLIINVLVILGLSESTVVGIVKGMFTRPPHAHEDAEARP